MLVLLIKMEHSIVGMITGMNASLAVKTLQNISRVDLKTREKLGTLNN